MYNSNHPMKPHRIRMTDQLVKSYGMDKLVESMAVDEEYYDSIDLTKFHSDDYIDFLKNVTPENKEMFSD